MAEIPAEAVQAAAEALQAMDDAPDTHSTLAAFQRAVAKAALEAAAPLLAEQVRREVRAEQLQRVARMVSWGATDSWMAAHGLPPNAGPGAILRAVEEWCRNAARQIGDTHA